MALSRLAEKCRVCPFVSKCDNKRMEAIGYLQPALAPNYLEATEQISRKVVKRHAYEEVFWQYEDEIKKELEKALYRDLYKGLCNF